MSVEERLRRGLAANAETLDMHPVQVDEHLAGLYDSRRRQIARLWSTVVLTGVAMVAGALLLVGPAGTVRSVEPVDIPTPERTAFLESDAAFTGARVPDGTWQRVATLAEARRRGLDMDLVQDVLGPDGRLLVELRLAGETWGIYVTGETGDREVGDGGRLRYDSAGRLVLSSRAMACAECVFVYRWTVTGDRLRLSIHRVRHDPTGITDDERLVTEGVFRRVS